MSDKWIEAILDIAPEQRERLMSNDARKDIEEAFEIAKSLLPHMSVVVLPTARDAVGRDKVPSLCIAQAALMLGAASMISISNEPDVWGRDCPVGAVGRHEAIREVALASVNALFDSTMPDDD